MILQEATKKYKGYYPEDLKPYSNKRICVVCDNCYGVRWVPKNNYSNLCKSCSRKNYGMFGKNHSNKTKAKMSKNHRNINGKNNPRYNQDMSGKNNPNYNNHKLAGKNNPMYNIHRIGENAPNWKGGITGNRDHVLSFNQCLKINKYFKGSHRHHISADVIVYIPSELHYHIYHNLKSGKGMNEMNMLSLQYLKGEL